ncbi:MAG: IPT/TIG domain-containing protein [bacterium]
METHDAVFLPVPEMAESIVRAVGLVAMPGSLDFGRFTEGAKCPFPQYLQMNELYNDSFGVLNGDPFATRRFIDGLEMLGHNVRSSAPVPGRDVPRLRMDVTKEPHNHPRISPFDGPVVSPAKTIPIFAAGAMLSRAGMFDLDRFTSTVSFMMCGFEQFGALHRAALDAFADTAARGRFAAMLDFRFPECGPMPGVGDPGIGLPTRSDCIPWLDWHGPCLTAVIESVVGDPAPYLITSVTPLRACPGDTLTIAGTGFGTTSGLVVFRRLGGGTMEIAATTWTDTAIMVKVPQQAAAGLWLKIPVADSVVCGVAMNRYLPGQSVETFDGSAPYIEALYAGHGPQPPYIVEPNDLLNINWRVFGAANVTVEVMDNGTGVSLARSDPAPSIGAFVTLRAPVSNVSRLITVRVDAEGVCVPRTISRSITILVTKDPLLAIEGIEVTQGVQYYRSAQHLTDPTDYGPDNSLPLVAGKAAWARVYVRSFRDPLFDNGLAAVAGSLLVERLDSGSTVLSSTTLPSTPTNAIVGANAAPVYANQRGLLSQTLNFVIPELWMAGRVRLTATLTQPSSIYAFPVAPASVTIDPVLNRQLRVTLIPVGYNGPDAVDSSTMKIVAPPTVANMVATLSDSLAMLPMTSAPDIRALPAHTRTMVLAEDPKTAGGCFTNVGDLMGDINAVTAADGNRTDAVYVALYANGIPQLFGGCGGGNLAVTEMGFPMVCAHELSHAIGRGHTPCGDVGTPDPNYPAYEPYDTPMAKMALLGEYGLDIRDGTIHRPKPLLPGDLEEHDFMSYCAPFWVSPYGYLFTNGHLPGLAVPTPLSTSPGGSGSPPRSAMYEPSASMWVTGSIEDDRCQVQRVAQVELRQVPGGAVLPYVVELLDADGVRLAGASLRGVSQAGCGCGGGSASAGVTGESSVDPQARIRFNAYLPVLTNAVRLRIRRGEVVLWEHTRPATRPQITMARCVVGRDGNLAIKWKSKVDKTAKPEVWLQWRADDSTEWRALRVGITENAIRIPLECLPSGKVRIRAILHDGFSTVNAQSSGVKIPSRSPQVAIIHPADHTVAQPGSPMLLWGYAAESTGDIVPGDSLTWRINGRVAGTGRTLPIEVPVKGSRLRVELEVTDSHGTSTALRTVTLTRPS